MLQFYLICT